MLVSDFCYDLPEERIAKFPPEERGSTRLCVLKRANGQIVDSFYRNLDEWLEPGDVIVLNDTKVMQSRLFCELPDGRPRELVVLEKHGDEPERVMYRGKLHEGDVLRDNLSMLQTEDEREYGRYRDTVGDWRDDLNYLYTAYSDMSQQEYNRYMNDRAAWEADRAYWYQKAYDEQQQRNWEKEFKARYGSGGGSSGGGSGSKKKTSITVSNGSGGTVKTTTKQKNKGDRENSAYWSTR